MASVRASRAKGLRVNQLTPSVDAMIGRAVFEEPFSVVGAFNVYKVKSGQSLTIVRSGAATYMPTPNTVAAAPANTLRVEPNGALIEPAATNLMLQSETFDNAFWSSQGGGTTAGPTVTANQAVAPDGNTTADLVAYPAVSGGTPNRSILFDLNGLTLTAASYTLSIWLRAQSGTATIYLSATPDGASYQSTTCSLTTTWQRFSLTFTATAATWYNLIGVDMRDASQTAKSAQSVYCWGAQLELGSAATSYIQTVASASPRSADDVKAVFNFTLGAKAVSASMDVIVQKMSPGSQNIYIEPYVDGSNVWFMGQETTSQIRANGFFAATSHVAVGGVVSTNVSHHAVYRYDGVNETVILDRVPTATAFNYSAPTAFNGIVLGNDFGAGAGVDALCGWIKNIKLYATPLGAS